MSKIELTELELKDEEVYNVTLEYNDYPIELQLTGSMAKEVILWFNSLQSDDLQQFAIIVDNHYIRVIDNKLFMKVILQEEK